jgi:RNA exonuclease 4
VDAVPDSPLVNDDRDNDDNHSHEEEEQEEGRRKTRRSRRGGYRRKRQQQKKVAALMAASAAERARKLLEAACDNSSQTSTTEEESSSGESSGHKSPQRVVARKKGSVAQQLLQLQNQQLYIQQSYYQGPPMHPAAVMYSYPPYGYPAPAPQQRKSKRYPAWDISKPSHQAQFLAMDCEMVGVGEGGGHSALARVTLIDFHGNVVMDELVKPQWEVTDYRTFVSGITKEMLDNATMDFATARKLVLRHLKGKVLVGHALRNDLGVLGITHPWYMIRDTAKYDPYMKLRMDGCLWPRSLKDLCLELLGRDVQVYGRPHCPKEDAMAALDLYRLVSPQWEKSIVYQRNNGWTMPPSPM